MSDDNKSDLERLTDSLEKNADKPNQSLGLVSFTDLFTPDFMSKYTKFANFGELLIVGKYNVSRFEEFLALLNAEFDKFIAKNTNFKTWEEMQSTAVSEYYKRQEAAKQ
ncbi:hypothetical protein [Desulfosporosinus hippei]|uniref:Uncharacterized protein n=1 Tax=Desulfosporosinus hippei DSM 8344 TaxID=1121419 RepID=A0A1G8BK43_9FIRM|nr:hypothetical protein [Desulfosporosinus hippei]SDH33586.1 hypothetical protein SAMN05443529_11257 [Desulfosporosinus hippei DSM 8344]